MSSEGDVLLTTENVINTDAKDLAVVPEKPKPLTRQEIGKLRRHYITIVHGTVRACGDKFDSKRQPKNNCESCWEAYFMTVVDTAAIHDDFLKGGKKKLQTVYGDRFTKQFGIFLSAQLAKEANGEDNQLPETNTNDGSDNREEASTDSAGSAV